MSIRTFIALASVLFAGTALAQASLGTIGNVQGIVTVTDGATGGIVAPGSPITSGMRFIATSSGSATLQLNSGCTLTLQPGQSVTVLQSMTCRELTAAVQQVGGITVAGAGGSFLTGALAAGGLVAGAFASNKAMGKGRSISSN